MRGALRSLFIQYLESAREKSRTLVIFFFSCALVFSLGYVYLGLNYPQAGWRSRFSISVSITLALVLVALHTYFVSTVVVSGVTTILSEENSYLTALSRIFALGIFFSLVSIGSFLIVLAPSETLLLSGCVIIIGLYVWSGYVIRHRLTTRELTDKEKQACGAPAKTDIVIRKVVGHAGENVNGASFGVLPWHKTILINRKSLVELDDEHIEALVAHELGHEKEHHAVILMGSAIITTLLFLLLIRSALWDAWREFTIALVFFVFSSASAAIIRRYLEFRADAFAATYLGSSDQVIAKLRALQRYQEEHEETESQTSQLIPTPVHTVWETITATHPSMENRIRRLSSGEEAEDRGSG